MSNSVVLRWENIRYTVIDKENQSKDVLKGLSGQVEPGQLCAILGPSGSGKTSLLNVLAQRVVGSRVQGNVLVNGVPPTMHFARISGYVQQETQFFQILTVRETLMYAAKLKLPYTVPMSEKEKMVEQLIRDLDLEKCANTRVGFGTSGGERRRLSLAMELIDGPSLIFCDEPTSGLDSASALLVVKILKDLAKSGKTIICTIHQPRASILPFFDQVLLLAEGKTMYYGPSLPKITDYFNNCGFPCPVYENPADYILDLINTTQKENKLESSSDIFVDSESAEVSVPMGNMNRSKVIQILHEKYLESDLCVQMMKPSDKAPQLTNQQNTDTFDSRYPTPWYYQFRVIFSRYFLYKLREPVAAMTMLTNSIFMAVLLGIIFYKPPLVDTFVQTRLAAASFVIIVQAFLAYDIILLWPKERAVYLEEHSTGLYSTGSFYWARTLCDAPFHFACGIIIGSITYWMFGFQVDASKFFIFMAFIQLVTFCGTSLFLMLSSLSQTMEQANLLATLVLSLFVLFNGTFTNAKTTPSYLKWMESVSFINHGVQVLAKNEYSGLSFSCSGDLGVQCAFTSGDSFLNFLGYSDVSEWKSALILIGMIVVYRFAAYLGVKYLYTGKSLKELIKNKSE